MIKIGYVHDQAIAVTTCASFAVTMRSNSKRLPIAQATLRT
ncbi:hypothetical protein [Trichocoleus sp. Lan]